MTVFLLCWYRSGCFKAYLFKTGRNLALRFGATRGRLQTFAIEELTEEPSSPGAQGTVLCVYEDMGEDKGT